MTYKENITRFILAITKWSKENLVIILLLLLISPLFFYKLGQSSLVSWDEAWYADIARNIVTTQDWIYLQWNDKAYYDHPPTGFWIMASTFSLFGINDFTARFASAVFGILSLLVIYLLGKDLFNKPVGLLSALALSSSFWFLSRARSGNLDIFLTFFFIFSLWLSYKSTQNARWMIPLVISLIFLFLTKSLVPFTILPALAIIFWGSYRRLYKHLLYAVTAVFVTLFTWMIFQEERTLNYLNHYLSIGYPGASAESSIKENILLTKSYIHNGIGKWFWPGIAAIIFSPFLLQKRFLVLSVFFISFTVPFFFSPRGQIWHLIPIHPIMILSFFGFSYVVLQFITKQKRLTYLGITLFGLYFALLQIRQSWYQFIDIPAYVSDEAILSIDASKYPYDYFIAGDFEPAAAFYSGKVVQRMYRGGIKDLFNDTKPFVLFSPTWRLEEEKIDPSQYRIIKIDRDKVLLIGNENK